MSHILRRVGIDALVLFGLSYVPTPAHIGAVFGALVLLVSGMGVARTLVRHKTRATWWWLFFVWLTVVAWSVLMPQWFTASYWYHAVHMSAVVWIQATVLLMSLGFLGDGVWTLVSAGWTASRLDPSRRVSGLDVIRHVRARLFPSES